MHDSLTISFSSTYSQSKSQAKSVEWSDDINYKVPPRKRARIDFSVTRVKYNVPFTVDVEFEGEVALWCWNKVQGHNYWMPYPQSVIGSFPGCSGNRCRFNGIFTGVQGIMSHSSYKYCELNKPC